MIGFVRRLIGPCIELLRPRAGGPVASRVRGTAGAAFDIHREHEAIAAARNRLDARRRLVVGEEPAERRHVHGEIGFLDRDAGPRRLPAAPPSSAADRARRNTTSVSKTFGVMGSAPRRASAAAHAGRHKSARTDRPQRRRDIFLKSFSALKDPGQPPRRIVRRRQGGRHGDCSENGRNSPPRAPLDRSPRAPAPSMATHSAWPMASKRGVFVALAGATAIVVRGPDPDSRRGSLDPFRVGLDHVALGCETGGRARTGRPGARGRRRDVDGPQFDPSCSGGTMSHSRIPTGSRGNSTWRPTSPSKSSRHYLRAFQTGNLDDGAVRRGRDVREPAGSPRVTDVTRCSRRCGASCQRSRA